MAIQLGNITTSGTAVYTSSGNTVITFLSICNYTGNAVTANIWVVPNGGSAGNTNIAIATIELQANSSTAGDTYQFYAGNEKLILGNGDFIQIDASANNSLTSITSFTSA
jgi:hypothetical protein